MTIGQMAARFGLRTSAIRYYESIGLLKSVRIRGRRQFGEDAAARLELITAAKRASFSLEEIRQILIGGKPNWRSAATSKLQELDATINRAVSQREAVSRLLRCQCGSIAECAAKTASTRGKAAQP